MVLEVVSIRSPHKCKGRRSTLAHFGAHVLFQSAPLTNARGDASLQPCLFVCACFNPLPSQMQGETGASASHAVRRSRFNPLPSQMQGETRTAERIERGVEGFQSAPLTNARGDPTPGAGRGFCFLFQSAPLTNARGDARIFRRSAPATRFQSAPLTNARGDPATTRLFTGQRRFQSAPLTNARGDLVRCRYVKPPQAFQSAPLTNARGDPF